MKRVLVPSLLLVAAIGTTVAVTGPSATTAGPPKYVTVSTDGGIFVGTGIPGQPLVGASVANGEACVGFSYQTGTCVPLNHG